MENFIKGTLYSAGKILLSQQNKKNFIKYKTDNKEIDFKQILTGQDLLINDFILESINQFSSYPNIISEESSANNFSLEIPTWVVDPIDGSMNYFKGIEFYCISLAYWEGGEPKFAGVYSPYNNEMFFAEKGHGATLNGLPIFASNITNVNDSLVLISSFSSFKKHEKEDTFIKIVSSIDNIRILSSSILDMCYVAAGRCEGRVYSCCKFWDLSAAKLILEEAGGMVTDWSGNSTNIFSPFIIASNQGIHSLLSNLVK